MKTINAQDLLDAYNGQYNYITQDKDGEISLFTKAAPHASLQGWLTDFEYEKRIGKICIAEFQGKPWEECIYKNRIIKDLLPCPFCGRDPVLLPGNMVECMTTTCPMHPDCVMSVEEWNNRDRD